MTEERFFTNGFYIYDNFHDGEKWLVNEVEVKEIVNVMNNLDIKARERGKALSRLQKETQQLKDLIILMGYTIKNENGTITLELKQ